MSATTLGVFNFFRTGSIGLDNAVAALKKIKENSAEQPGGIASA